MPVDGEVWHYTTAAGLIGILTENVLRAGSAAFMNDHREIHAGQVAWNARIEQEAQQVTESLAQSIRNLGSFAISINPYDVYVACACRSGNNLTMWRNYTGVDVGFAIQLDPTKPLSMRRQHRAEDIIFPSDRELPANVGGSEQTVMDLFNGLLSTAYKPLRWEDAIYNPDKQNAIMDNGVKKYRDYVDGANFTDVTVKDFFEFMLDLERHLQLFKNIAFKDELERRIVSPLSHPYLKRAFMKYRPGKYGVVPFVELGIPEGESDAHSDGPQTIRRLPILRVTVGPTPYPEAARRSVLDLLGSCGYGDVPVDSSEIPFRR
ncbi:hypothetical protein [Sinomonas sp. P47F7]|uniref:hypothetical protein n=1 Tax=Sinomonas sp. P47F7 TaxID=3410987 RepID=UPI003BF585ED